MYGDPHNNCNYNEFGLLPLFECHLEQRWHLRDSATLATKGLRERVGGAEQEDSLSKARVKHDERGHQMNGWLLRARLSPESKCVQTLHKSLG